MSSPAEIGEIENLVWKLIESGLSYIFSLLKTFFSLDCGWKTCFTFFGFSHCACTHSTTGHPAKVCEENSKDAATRCGSASAWPLKFFGFSKVLLNTNEGLKGREVLIIYHKSVADVKKSKLSENERKPWCLSQGFYYSSWDGNKALWRLIMDHMMAATGEMW